METGSTIESVRAAVGDARARGARIGFVPTMGALHRGHVSLVERSVRETSYTVMSIYVNPLQFGPAEDHSRYPRPVDDDERLATEGGVDFLFRPDDNVMYSKERTVTITGGPIARDWEGASRPGHFDGVLTVVAKLFNIVRPDVAVFGQKDLQQTALVRAMIRDLDFAVDMIVSPVVRETDGLALSSRNRYLSEAERRSALSLSRALFKVRRAFQSGLDSGKELEDVGMKELSVDPLVKADYLAVVNPRTFRREESASPQSAAIVAARVGSTRLIDNVILGEDDQD